MQIVTKLTNIISIEEPQDVQPRFNEQFFIFLFFVHFVFFILDFVFLMLLLILYIINFLNSFLLFQLWLNNTTCTQVLYG